MKIYKNINVFDESLNRIRFLFDEFEDVVVNFSGGKDSTVLFNLALIVAKEKNRLPLKVFFLDQEGEWQCTIDYIKKVMNNPDVDPYWFQIPFRIFNASSYDEPWLNCWEEGKHWMREKDELSYKENIYGVDRFKDLFKAIHDKEFSSKKTCKLGGVRCEESPTRERGLTGSITYKHITWGRIENKAKNNYTFYPLYDWTFTDVWKAIHDNNWDYCKLYDYMYRYGVPRDKMRVSNITHETALASLYFMQEVEKETWNKLVNRIKGINTVGQGKDDFLKVKELPFMFESWTEYRDYLLDNLINSEEIKEKFRNKFNNPRILACMDNELFNIKFNKKCIQAILKNDYHSSILDTFTGACTQTLFIRYKTKGIVPEKGNIYYEYEQRNKETD